MSAESAEIPPPQAAALDALADAIKKNGKPGYEKVRGVFGLLGDKWAILILLILFTGRMRHAALRRTLDRLAPGESISQRMLTLKLRQLEQLGLLDRHVSDDVPPRVDYGLTDDGAELTVRVRSMIDWLVQGRNDSRPAALSRSSRR